MRFPAPSAHPTEGGAPPGAHFRVPQFANLEATYKNATIAIQERTIKDRVVVILARMARDLGPLVGLRHLRVVALPDFRVLDLGPLAELTSLEVPEDPDFPS